MTSLPACSLCGSRQVQPFMEVYCTNEFCGKTPTAPDPYKPESPYRKLFPGQMCPCEPKPYSLGYIHGQLMNTARTVTLVDGDTRETYCAGRDSLGNITVQVHRW